MARTWQTDEVIRCLVDADQDELQDLIEGAGDEAAEALQEWVREGNAPKASTTRSCVSQPIPNIHLIQ